MSPAVERLEETEEKRAAAALEDSESSETGAPHFWFRIFCEEWGTLNLICADNYV